jgi:hypothetical protein
VLMVTDDTGSEERRKRSRGRRGGKEREYW